MKKLWVLFAVLMVLILFPSFGINAQTWNYRADFGYFAQDGDWWTGVSVWNATGNANAIYIQVNDASSDGSAAAAEGEFPLNGYQQRAGLLSSFITWGSLPAQGSFIIFSTQPFVAVKFTGNSTMGGFSEVQITATSTH